jgi:hypothetical protein
MRGSGAPGSARKVVEGTCMTRRHLARAATAALTAAALVGLAIAPAEAAGAHEVALLSR